MVYEFNFDSFVKHIPDTCRIHVRIADDVLEEEDWGIDQLTIIGSRVIEQTTILKGVYRIPDMMNWTADMIVEWSNIESTFGTHPQNFHEVSLI